MNFSIFVLLSFAFSALAAKKNPGAKCPYRETVDLTNLTTYDNGSYIYQGILIPPEKQFFYNYHLQFRNEKVSVPVHLRGCVCYESKPCIKLCCAKTEFFRIETFKCERITKDMKIKWDLSARTSNGTEKIFNVFQKFIHQVGVPCEKPEPLIMDIDNWVLLENGEIYIELERSHLDTVNYCLTPYKSNDTEEYSLMAYSCPLKYETTWTLILNTYAMAVSVLFLIPTIVVYIIIKELRGNIRGKILICYLLSMVMAYSIISVINISHIVFDYIACSLLGYTCYFFFTAAFLWWSVLCYDIWNYFKENNVENNLKGNYKRFIYYSLNAWGWSSIFTLLTIWADLSPSIEEIYKPGIGIEMCWVNTKKWSAAIYFYVPNLIILLLNYLTFTCLTVHICKVRRYSAKIAHKERYFQENVMGAPWIFDIISYCLPDTVEWQYMFILSDLVYALQGLSIFTLFVLKRNVLNLLKKRFKIDKSIKLRRSNLSLNSTNTTKLKKSSSIEISI